MALMSCQDLRVLYGDRPLLDSANLQIENGERIGLVGRNGEGKSTLLQILAGELEPDEGILVREPGLKVGLLPQKAPSGVTGTVGTMIRSGASQKSQGHHSVLRLCSLLDLDSDQDFSSLSGGQRRRALLGRALAADPDLLLLDEPTNHLDLEGIEWLETFLARYKGSLLFVTHDRAFLQRLSTRIIELDRGRLTSWACDYPTYLRRKAALLGNEEKEWALFDKNLAKEEEWIRKGIKARRTRNEGRVRALEALREQRAQRRERLGTVRVNIQEADRSGARVIVAKDLGFEYDDVPLIRNLSATIYRGDKVGIIGPNGCGKTTLLNLLLGNLNPDSGTVKHGISLEVSHFDQQREALEEERTVAESVERGSDFLMVDGKKRHVLSYLQDFLFSPSRAKEPVSSLSGGERSRLLLARLFARPANLLVLDEPTNDLDSETLELMEARLLDFKGTVLAVSHDRTFLDNLCSSTLVFEGKGIVKEYVGGYSDWQRVVKARIEDSPTPPGPRRDRKGTPVGKGPQRPSSVGRGSSKPARLSYQEKKEWEDLPARIEALEEELEALHEEMARPDFFQGDPETIKEATARSQALPREIDSAFARWADLDQRISG
ncbi:MAG: ATP-binding cassette domain-containing protein [Gemmatimonadetes bacterium]|nr:ATP-binding cassette domain-containing protein [Gemmatimonadota bacterium]NNM03604.1 ATP-binding cassette domain-containing protein [Gemmatimonadota bacterium]